MADRRVVLEKDGVRSLAVPEKALEHWRKQGYTPAYYQDTREPYRAARTARAEEPKAEPAPEPRRSGG